MEKDILKNRLKIAFEAIPQPKTVSDGCPRKQCREIEQWFGGKKRNNLSQNEILILSNDFGLLNPKAFQYFLPVLLEASLTDIKSITFDMFVQNLFCYPKLKGYRTQKEKFNLLTIVQSDIVLKIIEYWIKYEDIGEYWTEELTKSLPYWRKKAKQ
jgi:hypothetical protein